MKLIYAVAAAVQLCAFSVFAQGNFENLNFEAANIPAGTPIPSELSASAAFPGWSASTPYVVYDAASLGGVTISIIDSSAPSYLGITPLQGNYSVVLFAGGSPPGNTPSISQTGLVPANAQSIQMDIAVPSGFTAGAFVFVVALGGQSISMSPLQTFPNYTVYGGNISTYADKMETLSITQLINAPPYPPGPSPTTLEVDDIVFSPNVIPEPGTWALMLCGATLLGLSRWKRT